MTAVQSGLYDRVGRACRFDVPTVRTPKAAMPLGALRIACSGPAGWVRVTGPDAGGTGRATDRVPLDPLHVTRQVDNQLAVFRVDDAAKQARGLMGQAGLPDLPEPLFTLAVEALLREVGREHPEAPHFLVRPTLELRADGVRLALFAWADEEVLGLDVAPVTLTTDVAALASAHTLMQPQGTQVFFRHDDRIQVPPAAFRQREVAGSPVRDLLADLGFEVRLERLSLPDLKAACDAGQIREAFAWLAPARIVAVGGVEAGPDRWAVGSGQPGPATIALWRRLSAVRRGETADRHRWMRRIG